MTRKIFAEIILGISVVTLVTSNVLLASRLVAVRERISFQAAPAVAVAQEVAPSPDPEIISLLATVWTLPQSTTTSDKIKISSLAPTVGAGPINTKATIKGIGFAPKNNTVIFGYHRIEGLKSNGNTLEFLVPGYLVYPCVTGQPCPTQDARKVIPGQYPVYVSNTRGTSRPATFIVTDGPSPSIAP